MNNSGHRPIRQLLVANRGEIATRIISAARELDIETYALYTENDSSHAYHANHAIRLDDPASYMNIDALIKIIQKHGIDAVHPGYGFLSESPGFACRVEDETGATVIGPGPEILDRTGDKLQARRLADECQVPVLPALTTPTNDVHIVTDFAERTGYPIMIKAVDGGGGRGTRLVREPAALESSLKRAIEESPSKQVFVEKAAVSGYRHIEIQVVGDRRGNVTHLWERECSIQRRYQKVVELAPSTVTDRKLIGLVIESALKMARKINYWSLGTFEFLVNSQISEFYFLEINPRLQVEHTITESICAMDIVRAQLLIAQGASLQEAGVILTEHGDPKEPPALHSMQLRITAEDPTKNWSLSVGKIQSSHFPSGNGIRVDTNLISGTPAVVTTDFDSLLAKIIITAPTWQTVLQKGKRALQDTRIIGIQTNIPILQTIISHQDFIHGKCDTQWLESHQTELLSQISNLPKPSTNIPSPSTTSHSTSTSLVSASSSVLFRPNDAWSLTLTPQNAQSSGAPTPYHVRLNRVLQNDFPSTLSAEIALTNPSTPNAEIYKLSLASTSASSMAASSSSRRGDPSNPAHVLTPVAGKLIEILVDEGDVVRKGDAVAVVRQMKMELDVRASRAGKVGWVFEGEEGDEVGEGTLVAVLEDEPEGEGREKAKL